MMQVYNDIKKFQGHFLQGQESTAVPLAVCKVVECANQYISQAIRSRAEETFHKMYPQGEEVAEWLSSHKLAHFTSTFSALKLNTLRKISEMTQEDVLKVHRTFLLQVCRSARSRLVRHDDDAVS